jgi:uncharacterized protein (TIGR00159 family)
MDRIVENLWFLLVPAIEVMVIAAFIYYLISFFWNTRAKDLAFGLLAFMGVYGLSGWFNFTVLNKLLQSVVNLSIMAVIILFQPEIRLALTKLSLRGKGVRDIPEFDKFLDSLSIALYRLADRRIGALVILENQDSLEEFADNAVRIDAKFSPELLESLFVTTTPLHDGGVLIRGDRILSAATILPLAAEDSTQALRSMGTRHRAALGISQVTDALTIAVSEETGKVSIARDGIMTRSVKPDRFKEMVKIVYTPTHHVDAKGGSFIKKVKAWSQ